MKILNAFSLNMISGDIFLGAVNFQKISLEDARAFATGAESAVGHADTAAVFSAVLGHNVPMNRTTVTLKGGGTALVGQYKGPRLPEGATALPEGAVIEWYWITVVGEEAFKG